MEVYQIFLCFGAFLPSPCLPLETLTSFVRFPPLSSGQLDMEVTHKAEEVGRNQNGTASASEEKATMKSAQQCSLPALFLLMLLMQDGEGTGTAQDPRKGSVKASQKRHATPPAKSAAPRGMNLKQNHHQHQPSRGSVQRRISKRG